LELANGKAWTNWLSYRVRCRLPGAPGSAQHKLAKEASKAAWLGAFLASLCVDFREECMSGSGMRSRPIRLRQDLSFFQPDFKIALQDVKGSLEP
jgi:hypothetical protein